MQSVAFDFLKDKEHIYISEISYCCGINSNKGFQGYWTEDMKWHDYNNINICDWIIEDLIAKLGEK